jgi:hypothetical protein
MTATAISKQVRSISLHVDDPDQADATLPIRWCIHRSVIDRLKEKRDRYGQCIRPFLLICVLKEVMGRKKEVERKLVPLTHIMEFLTFYSPGEYTVRAFIVWSSKGDRAELANYFLTKQDVHTFRNELFDYIGEEPQFDLTEPSCLWDSDGRRFEMGEVRVQVSEEFFAPEPPKWVKRIVNSQFMNSLSSKPADQCAFRRKAILAFTIQPLCLAVWLPLRLVIMIAVFLFFFLGGFWRGLTLRPFLYFWRAGFTEVNSRETYFLMNNNVFFEKRDQQGNYLGEQPFLLRFFMPWLVLLYLSAGGTYFWAFKAYGLENPFVFGSTVVVALVLLVPIVTLVVSILLAETIDKAMEKVKGIAPKRLVSFVWQRSDGIRGGLLVWKKSRKEAIEQRKQSREERREQRWATEISPVVCTEASANTSLGTLPLTRSRKVYLRVKAFKNKICRPIAK